MQEPAEEREPERLPPDTVLEGRYRLEGALGDGGIGWVYRAEHLKLGQSVAIKMLQPQYANHPQMRPRFEREARALASLHHPNIVSVTDYSLSDGRPYLVMELLEGRPLDAVLADGLVEHAIIKHLAVQILDALAYAHEQGLVHRDLKPANLFVCDLPTDPHHLKVLDFGFVKLVEGDVARAKTGLTRSGVAFGTPGYMPPEQAVGGEMDARTDLYSFTVVLFQMVAGRRPFVGEMPEVVRQHLTEPVPELSVGGRPVRATPAFRALLERGMAKTPGDRFQTAGELQEALLALEEPWTEPVTLRESETLPAVANDDPVATDPTLAATPASRAGSENARATSNARAKLRLALGVASVAAVASAGLAAYVYATAPDAEVRPIEAAMRADEDPPAERLTPEDPVPELLAAPAQPPAADMNFDAPLEPGEGVATDLAPDGEGAEGEADASGDADPSSDTDTSNDTDSSNDTALSVLDPWQTRPVSPVLARARARVLAGRALSRGETRNVRTLVQRDRTDPRPHLVVAQSFAADGQESLALQRYDLALRVDRTARGDPRMLEDLVRLSLEGDARAEATSMLQRVYPERGPARVRELLEDETLDDVRRGELELLLPQLLGEAPIIDTTPVRTRRRGSARRRTPTRGARRSTARRRRPGRRRRARR